MKRINLMEQMIRGDMRRTYSELDPDHQKKVDDSVLRRKRGTLQSISTSENKVTIKEVERKQLPRRMRIDFDRPRIMPRRPE